MIVRTAILSALALVAFPANAEVVAKAPDGFSISFSGEVAVDKNKAWRRLVSPRLWWKGTHSYSGDAANFRLTEKAGGCWCEIWNGNEVEHGRVVTLMPGATLRVDGAFGPLQEMGVTGAMTFQLAAGKDAGRTKVTLTYVVTGSALSKLDEIAPAVDNVLAEQFASLIAAK